MLCSSIIDVLFAFLPHRLHSIVGGWMDGGGGWSWFLLAAAGTSLMISGRVSTERALSRAALPRLLLLHLLQFIDHDELNFT